MHNEYFIGLPDGLYPHNSGREDQLKKNRSRVSIEGINHFAIYTSLTLSTAYL
jgi:hypothetical protein